MPLKPLVIEKGIIQPSFSKRKHSSLFRKNLIQGGVLTDTGLPVKQSKVVINEREIICPYRINPSETEIEFVDEDAIYFSIPQNHFGHVLTGTMAFAYVLLNSDYLNHKIVFINEKPGEHILILLGHLGVDRRNVMTINQYVQFRSVVVAKPSLRIVWLRRFGSRWFRINEEIIDTFRAIAKKANECPNQQTKKVYFSRGKLRVRPIWYEDKIERVFKKNGYEIFYPEQLPLDEQIKLVANADFYVCIQGTLEHHSLFMKDNATFIVMSRRWSKTERQVLINKLQNRLKHVYLRANIQPLGDHALPNIIGATKDIINFFNEYKFTYNLEDLILTDKEIDDYVNGCELRDIKLIPIMKRLFRAILKRILIRHRSLLRKLIK